MSIQYLIIILQILFIIRFHMEISRVEAYQEPANTLRRITNPLVLTLKGILPHPIKKGAAIIIAFAVAVLGLFVGVNVAFSALDVLLLSLLLLVRSWVMFLQYGIFIFVVGSWVQIQALMPINYFLHQLFEPVLGPIRRVLPTPGGLDFSPMVLLIALSFISNWFFSLFQ